MGRCCAVHGCLSGRKASENVEKVALFKAPKDVELRSKWSSALGQELKASSFICELHFNPENVIKTDREILKDGSVYVYEYQKVHLRKKAEPKSHTNDDNENNCSLLLNNDSSTISDINDDTTRNISIFVGCDEHKKELTKKIINNFIIMRGHFLVKCFNKSATERKVKCQS
ncbi:uncharacterized protein LOC124293046 [Neodiprion lecontei]|uniref:Uncharacterized protein LOC124293046 n=1 Tax=Neodiprion lecontei TaxID=441921 RepID=A0ABM3FJ37_NEOLC|nr:uncharacterized protein LOC124293046 [Neodiprion lecontei]